MEWGGGSNRVTIRVILDRPIFAYSSTADQPGRLFATRSQFLAPSAVRKRCRGCCAPRMIPRPSSNTHDTAPAGNYYEPPG